MITITQLIYCLEHLPDPDTYEHHAIQIAAPDDAGCAVMMQKGAGDFGFRGSSLFLFRKAMVANPQTGKQRIRWQCEQPVVMEAPPILECLKGMNAAWQKMKTTGRHMPAHEFDRMFHEARQLCDRAEIKYLEQTGAEVPL